MNGDNRKKVNTRGKQREMVKGLKLFNQYKITLISNTPVPWRGAIIARWGLREGTLPL